MRGFSQQASRTPSNANASAQNKNGQPHLSESMKSMKRILLTLALSGFASIASAQQLGGSDLGQTAPTPGANDVYQLNQTTTGGPLSSAPNSFYDNTSPPVGSSFTTGANSGGYTMTSLAIKFGGTTITGGTGYAGAADTTLDPGWTITLYQLSGTGNTTATPIYTNTVGTLTGTANTGGDWVQITGFNKHLLASTSYAWTISSGGYDDLGWFGGSPQYAGGSICQIPLGGGAVTYADVGTDSAVFDVGLVTGPILLGGADLGQTAPVPGASDAYQLLQTTSSVLSSGPGSLNDFYDNTAIGGHGSSGYVGSSFSTGINPGGYSLTSLAIKFGGSPPGYAGGADTSLNPGWIITIYKLSGPGNTSATPVYTNTVGALSGTANTGGDWVEITGFSAALTPNSTYAWTIYSSGYDDLGWFGGSPQYTGGAICEIPPGGGAVAYYLAGTASATFDVGLTPIKIPLTAIDLGQTAPTPGSVDAAQVLEDSSSVLSSGPGSLNDFYDNTAIGSHGSTGYVGSSFSTGSNPGGYALNSLSIKFGGSPPGYAGGADTGTSSGGWTIGIYQLSGTGDTNATLVYADNVGTVVGNNTGGDWVQISGFFQTLLPSTSYAWTIFSSGYDDLGWYGGTPQYAGGSICEIPPAGGLVTYYLSGTASATFDVGLSLEGYPAAGTPSASPNPCYALSPVTLSDTASGPGTLTYQWQTNSDLSGGLGGTWASIPDATNATLTFTPPNSDAGTLDFQLLVNNAAGTATSAPIALTVYSSQAPASSTGVTPSQITTYASGTATFSDASFIGTTPITYQWQVNTGSGYQNISSALNPSATNATLELTDVQAGDAGSYQLVATSSQGSANDGSAGTGAATLTVLPAPSAPVSTTPQNAPFLEYSYSPYAYWRLQETNNPANSPSTVFAYDYSGNGIFATYGTGVTTSNAGPEAPFFPGFTSTELAADTSTGTTGYLTVPPLNLTTTNISFLAWINPSYAQSSSTGLLFDRNGGDASGFGFNGNPNSVGMPCLGFTWNSNSSATWGWNSGLYPVAGDWSLVAYVITPTNETTYLFYVDTTTSPYTTNLFQNSLNLAIIPEHFPTTSFLGADTQQTSGRTFNGSMAEVALYTNSLSQQEVLNIFLAALGSKGAPVSAPLTLPSPSIFTGESIQIDGTAGGSGPISYQWMSSPDGSTWSDVPANANYSGVTSAILQINNATLADAMQYEVVVKNLSSTATSGVATVTVTAVPTGQWTMNFQVTNSTLAFSTSTSGGGQYTGHGVLGSGTYWNCFVNQAGAFAYGTFNTASDLLDDGATHSGIYASVNGSDDSTLTLPAASSSIATLLDQFVYGSTALTFTGIPDGTYSLVIYGIDGGFANGGDELTVNATNAVQTAGTANDQDTFFSQNGNSSLFTNVVVEGGTLVVNVGNDAISGSYNATINGAQLQLISYAPSASDNSITYAVTNNTMTLTWPEGVLQTATNLAGPWVAMPDLSPITVSTTNTSQFFRLAFPKP
jgi:hypothetical protein